MKITDESQDRRFATTLARGLSVLRAFRPSDDGLGNAEISERTGLPKSTVSRLTFTLQSLGYLSHARRHDRYRPGPALLALGNVASASISFVELSGPIMQRVADETGTLALLSVRDRGRVLITKTWRPQEVSSIWLEVGHRLPFKGSSSGHAMLAALSEEGFAEAVADARGIAASTRRRRGRRGASLIRSSSPKLRDRRSGVVLRRQHPRRFGAVPVARPERAGHLHLRRDAQGSEHGANADRGRATVAARGARA
ncbi:IclR family transcriptional regulator [Limimaricola cinnabarinus]|uniref:IclR family transcriptional regulator n=1 Tax=Limimaricola cinnabarinus TaxID=1125964 RepID=UPI000406595A|nr:helix-turn-helix domain-containing protein [Limimaricola cinnabarinus]